jgi:hypothetical protein
MTRTWGLLGFVMLLVAGCGISAGDKCDRKDEHELLCGSAGGKDNAVLICRDGKLQEVGACPGTQDCVDTFLEEKLVICGDRDKGLLLSVEGTPCETENNGACTMDRTGLLACRQGAWTLVLTCTDGSICNRTDVVSCK